MTCPAYKNPRHPGRIRTLQPGDSNGPTGHVPCGPYRPGTGTLPDDRTVAGRTADGNRSAHADGPARHAVHSAARTGVTYPVRERYTDGLAPPWHRPPQTTARRAAEAMDAMTILTPERPFRVYRRLPRTETAGKIHDRTEPGFPESGTFRTKYTKPKGVAVGHGFPI